MGSVRRQSISWVREITLKCFYDFIVKEKCFYDLKSTEIYYRMIEWGQIERNFGNLKKTVSFLV